MFTIETAAFVVVGLAVGAAAGFYLKSLLLARARSAAERTAEEILATAEKDAQRVRRDAELAAKDMRLQLKEESDREVEERRKEIKEQEKRIQRREETLEETLENVTRKERRIEEAEDRLEAQSHDLAKRAAELDGAMKEQREKLLEIAGMSEEQARATVLSGLEADLEEESGELILRTLERAKEEADDRARDIVVTAIQRTAANHSSESTVSVIDIPSDDMKGRIIGREGRNIRAFEKATGVDVIVDDTPGVIVLSAFDSVRRETARRAMEKLIADGRIHPSRIEEVVAAITKEMEEIIKTAGKKAVQDCGLTKVHPKLIELLGRLKWRTSYGQNVLNHSVEVGNVCGMIAAELGLNVKLAKRCGLLHDVGKAIDHEMEGGHPAIGADIARRCGEAPEVINSIASHHEDVPQESAYAVLTQAADAVSAARPGARRESLDRYIQRLERLEEVAGSFKGVKAAFAIQAGREVRVIVHPGAVTDQIAAKICRDIAQKIETELTYPGEVKVTVLRETRVVEYAR